MSKVFYFSKRGREHPDLLKMSARTCNAATKLYFARKLPLKDAEEKAGELLKRLPAMDVKELFAALKTLAHVNHRDVVFDTLSVCETVAKRLETENPKKAAALYERMEAFAGVGRNDLELLLKRLDYLEKAGDCLKKTSPWEAKRHYTNAVVSALFLQKLRVVEVFERHESGFGGELAKVKGVLPEFDARLRRLEEKKADAEKKVREFKEEVERRFQLYTAGVSEYNSARGECADCLHANYDPPLKVEQSQWSVLAKEVATEMFGHVSH